MRAKSVLVDLEFKTGLLRADNAVFPPRKSVGCEFSELARAVTRGTIRFCTPS
jgi:hypothetical protein